jgi:hypothetical protein
MNITQKARIAYGGAAIENGAMDVRDLAPALIAFSDLVRQIGDVIGSEHSIKVMLNADSIRRGSFDITFLLDVNILEQAKLFMSGAEESGLKAFMELLGWTSLAGGVGMGIFSLIKKVRGRRITAITHENDKTSTLHFTDNTTITVINNLLNVYLNVDCRKSVEKIVAPLARSGIDSFEIRDANDSANKTPLERIGKEELANFKAPEAAADEVATEPAEQVLLVKIISLNFNEGKWKLTDGDNTFWAAMEDEGFNEKVKRSEISFSKGVTLRIRFRIEQRIVGGVLSTTHTAVQVLEVREAPNQIKLDFDYQQK